MYVIGLMSGTSMDGIDGVLLNTEGLSSIEYIDQYSLSYEKNFIADLRQQSIHYINPEVVQRSSELHGKVIQSLIERNLRCNIDLIGYHGQTIYHNASQKITLQIGNAQLLANQFQLPVIYDFRTEDILHGGQGAPLAPLYHQALMQQKNLSHLILINIGGISNISILSHDIIHAGFDTGPGNVLLDQFVQAWTDHHYLMDINGNFAKSGNIYSDFLEVLAQKSLPDNYIVQCPPKSLDSKDVKFIPEILQTFPADDHTFQFLYDGCATLAAFTGYSIINNLNNLKKLTLADFKNWAVTGGGAKNPAILAGLKKFMPPGALLHTADQLGFNSTYMEAELIAWLAVRSVKKLPLTLPEVTGVDRPRTGGKCVYPA